MAITRSRQPAQQLSFTISLAPHMKSDISISSWVTIPLANYTAPHTRRAASNYSKVVYTRLHKSISLRKLALKPPCDVPQGAT